MLTSDNTLTPPSRPRSTEISATAVMDPIRITIAAEPVPQPYRKSNPASACVVPKPSEVASPNSVANTASVSMTCPHQPQIRSPRMGKNAERRVSGRLWLYAKNASASATTA